MARKNLEKAAVVYITYVNGSGARGIKYKGEIYDVCLSHDIEGSYIQLTSINKENAISERVIDSSTCNKIESKVIKALQKGRKSISLSARIIGL